ncbi:multidrug resistance-associated ABC transporter [Laccaria bicolor S238N-H82]|uniref:Multidrug resistance-associated ABC transporter n=1 Tax=Laccaria bicolor (strain S238N-H82 / ATCC MYA-4686) TaxID=486041 RepID=B0DB81_LACBS|nr:multidrug resistance-associated ABC transporter [Laccaria bicolor S238N-H82]EDR07940.1 multidrug resistance-associated ABC transporter [Laccaria bicolor S238N-H82]|eukprot:XP_001881010.1 multidrug resistance-associated ABC transporter [Laccaria bicolor S238N-H82]
MPRFQLPAAGILAGSAFASLITFYLTRSPEGKIQLPTSVDASEEYLGSDPFDVTTPEDVIDGYPIQAEAFWCRMRWRKLFISFLLSLTIVINTVALGFAAANEEQNDVVVASLQLFFSLYVFLLSARSVGQNTADEHANSILHVTGLTTVAFALLGSIAILPDRPPPVATSGVGQSEPVLIYLWYTLVGLYTILCVLTFTTPLGPPLYFPPANIYSKKTVDSITNKDDENVCGLISASAWDTLLFSYTTKVVWLGNIATTLDIGDLPIVPGNMRATFNYTRMKKAMREIQPRIFRVGSGWGLGYRLVRLNSFAFLVELVLASVSAVLFYAPALFLQKLVEYLEIDRNRENAGWGWVYAIGLFSANAVGFLVTGQLWSLATTTIAVRIKIQLNTILFAKTLVRKDVASSAPPPSSTASKDNASDAATEGTKKDDEDDFSSKSQIMTLMTTDVDRVSDFAWHVFALVDSPIEIVIGSIFLYKLLGVSCFFGLAVTCLFLPLNHFAGKVVVGAQENLMKARDERVALMNEILGGIRMLKFMAWERSFEARVLKVRDKELKYQKLNYAIETLWNAIWNGSPILVTLVSFWHFAVVRQQSLTPSIAFTSIIVFTEMKFALNALPETFINMLQSMVSLRRIEKYLHAAEVDRVLPSERQTQKIALQSCTVTWPQDRASASTTPSAASTPRHKFMLVDLSLDFPQGELSLICGKLGSGKTLLLLALLGEADVLTGQLLCPRSPPDSLASFSKIIPRKDEWVVQGSCAYVPQAAWLRNASIKENILFNLPYDEERYQTTLEVCALVSDLEILEDGDESEIGERGVNLSGGQKARVSLARAVYSRASILFLDDVLSAVDAHTAHHLYHQCLRGELMQGRTVILVSHHVQLCVPGASYVVALDNGRVQYQGSREEFVSSGAIKALVQSTNEDKSSDKAEEAELIEAVEEKMALQAETDESDPHSESSSTVAATPKSEKKPRKLVEEEARAVGRISRDIWETYIRACGNSWYWGLFSVILVIASLSPVLENGWLRYWSNVALTGDDHHESAVFYISVYAGITGLGLVISTLRWFVLYNGSIRASTVLYKRLLEAVLFANIRFHDTVSRGRLLNRFGKDFEGIDSNLSDNFGRTGMYGLSAITTLITVSVVGGLPFVAATLCFGLLYYSAAKIYGQTSRDMRRLDSVTRSPLYSMYGETISGVTILRAFGASSKFLRDMLRCVDTNANPFYWMWGVNRWLSVRFNLLSAGVVGATAVVCLITPSISASLAGFALAFASTITNDLLFMVRRFVGLEQSMVALERVHEYTQLKREPPEFIEPRPPTSWPSRGEIKCEDLVIRYAPELPNVLHGLNFDINPGEKVGILGRTGSGKSTLALSFFRFVEATEGRILVDGIDTATVGLTDLRSRLTIIPQDPTILSGSLRSTLDVFDEYQDAEIYEALRRVHLIPSEDTPEEAANAVNANVFRDLDSSVSEGGDNFSTGEKQLLCMARAILKRSKILVMDEATASVDYATDELIGKTIRQEFAESTILTIAHRLRTVIDYDRVMLLEQGRIIEFDRPATLLSNPASKFYALCKAAGKEEFVVLKRMAGV